MKPLKSWFSNMSLWNMKSMLWNENSFNLNVKGVNRMKNLIFLIGTLRSWKKVKAQRNFGKKKNRKGKKLRCLKENWNKRKTRISSKYLQCVKNWKRQRFSWPNRTKKLSNQWLSRWNFHTNQCCGIKLNTKRTSKIWKSCMLFSVYLGWVISYIKQWNEKSRIKCMQKEGEKLYAFWDPMWTRTTKMSSSQNS